MIGGNSAFPREVNKSVMLGNTNKIIPTAINNVIPKYIKGILIAPLMLLVNFVWSS